MTACYCDICGKKILPHEKKNLEGAISVLLEATEVCGKCYATVQSVDWREVVRQKILELRGRGDA